MSFQPVVTAPGLAGWRFLQRTYDSQFEACNKSPQLQRDSDYFLEKIGTITSAADLVKDRRLLGVALGAFGLQDDIDNRYFMQRILEDGSKHDDALANRLSDDRYQRLSAAFGFGPGELRETGNGDAMQALVAQNRVQSFEVAVGEQDASMRIAMYAARELPMLADKDVSEDARWFTMMGLPPLREMFETALGLPSSFGQIDIDKQAEIFRDRTQSVLGNDDMAQFSDPEVMERFTNLYLARAQIAGFSAVQSSGANALQLLSAAQGFY